MSSQSMAVAPVSVTSRTMWPSRASRKTRGPSPESLWVQNSPERVSASPDSSVGPSTCPTRRTFRRLQSAGMRVAVAVGTGPRAALPQPTSSAATSRPLTTRARQIALARLDQEVLAADPVADGDDAGDHSGQRTRAAVLDEPLRAADGRRGVLAGRPERALPAAPQLARLELLAGRGMRGGLARRQR